MGTFNSYTLNIAASDVTLYNLSIVYAEYQNRGPGASTKQHPEWVKLLCCIEADQYTLDQIFSGENHWIPPEMESDPAYVKDLQYNR